MLDQLRRKLDAKAREGIFIEVSETSKAYRIWDLEKRKVCISRDVPTDESMPNPSITKESATAIPNRHSFLRLMLPDFKGTEDSETPSDSEDDQTIQEDEAELTDARAPRTEDAEMDEKILDTQTSEDEAELTDARTPITDDAKWMKKFLTLSHQKTKSPVKHWKLSRVLPNAGTLDQSKTESDCQHASRGRRTTITV